MKITAFLIVTLTLNLTANDAFADTLPTCGTTNPGSGPAVITTESAQSQSGEGEVTSLPTRSSAELSLGVQLSADNGEAFSRRRTKVDVSKDERGIRRAAYAFKQSVIDEYHSLPNQDTRVPYEIDTREILGCLSPTKINRIDLVYDTGEILRKCLGTYEVNKIKRAGFERYNVREISFRCNLDFHIVSVGNFAPIE